MIFHATVSQFGDFDEIIDVRSPAEYDEDHVPGAVNYPVLNNEERARVGTIYKQISAFEAKKLGAALAAKNIAHHIQHAFLDRPKKWQPLVYCWRGGNRSSAMVHVLDQIGWRVARLDGGYKAYRRTVNADLLTLPSRFQWRVVCGPTGSGKSVLLQAIAQQGGQVLDLECLAAHRGSVLGNIPDARQPSQKTFETAIWDVLQRISPKRPLFVEAESKKIGRLQVPQAILQEMWQSPCVRLETALATRIALLKQAYAHFIASPDLLNTQLDCLHKLYGQKIIDDWRALSERGAWDDLVSDLLTTHYDPAYTKSTLLHYSRLSTALVLRVGGSDFAQLAKNILSAASDSNVHLSNDLASTTPNLSR